MTELLVVIVIIVVISGIMMASLRHFRRAADRASSLANIRQLGVALLTYASDKNGTMPPVSARPVPRTWDMAIGPYLGEEESSSQADYWKGKISLSKAFEAPGDRVKRLDGYTKRSYTMSQLIDGYGPSYPVVSMDYAMRVMNVADPASTVLLYETYNKHNFRGHEWCAGGSGAQWWFGGQSSTRPEGNLNYNQAMVDGKSSGIVVLFYDGHAGAPTWQDVNNYRAWSRARP